jgi:hypothetical protein
VVAVSLVWLEAIVSVLQLLNRRNMILGKGKKC